MKHYLAMIDAKGKQIWFVEHSLSELNEDIADWVHDNYPETEGSCAEEQIMNHFNDNEDDFLHKGSSHPFEYSF